MRKEQIRGWGSNGVIRTQKRKNPLSRGLGICEKVFWTKTDEQGNNVRYPDETPPVVEARIWFWIFILVYFLLFVLIGRSTQRFSYLFRSFFNSKTILYNVVGSNFFMFSRLWISFSKVLITIRVVLLLLLWKKCSIFTMNVYNFRFFSFFNIYFTVIE